MCFYWDSMQKKTVQMSLDEITKISKSLPNLFQLTLTGGEPSLNKNLPEIVKIFSKYSNLSKCTIVTNGMLYKRIGDFVEKMTIENPEIDFRLSLSVDAIGDLHDKIRGVKGSYDNVIKTFDILKKIRSNTHNLWVDMNTTVSKYNYQEFRNIHDHVINNFDVDVNIQLTVTDDGMLNKLNKDKKKPDKSHKATLGLVRRQIAADGTLGGF